MGEGGLDATDTLILIIGGFGLAYIAWEERLQYVDWIGFGIVAGSVLVSVTLVIFLLWCVYRVFKKKRAEETAKEDHLREQENRLLEALATGFSWFSSIEAWKKLLEIKGLIKMLPDDVTFKYEEEIFSFYDKTEAVIHEKELQEHRMVLEKQEKLRKEEFLREEFESQVNELLEFKKAEKSRKALPLDKEYSTYVIQEAERKAEDYLRRQEIVQMVRKEAIEYYRVNGLHTKPSLCSWHEEIYAEVRNGIREGKIPLKSVIENSGTPLEKKFYRAKGLSEEIKSRAVAQGFEYVRGVELDGKPSAGGFYIKKDVEKESNYHFITKHLFAELNLKMKVEFCVDGKRVDAAFISKHLKLGVEVETGSNKFEQLAAKIPWLNANFDRWIFVCPREQATKYSRLVDNEKSFCLTPKKAKEKVLELVASVAHR